MNDKNPVPPQDDRALQEFLDLALTRIDFAMRRRFVIITTNEHSPEPGSRIQGRWCGLKRVGNDFMCCIETDKGERKIIAFDHILDYVIS